MKIGQFINYLKEKRLSKNTVLAYKADLDEIERFLQHPLIEATENEIRLYMQTHLHLKASTMRRRHIALRRFFITAERNNFIEDNPILNIDPPKQSKQIPKYMSQREIEFMFNILRDDSLLELRNTAIIKLLYYTGIRIGELQQLNVTDIYWDTFHLRIKGKGNKERLVPLSSAVVGILDAWIKARSSIKEVKTPALFVTLGKEKHGERIEYGHLRRIVKHILKKAGLHNYSPHKLRHTFATQLLSRGAPLEQISKLLGHTRLDTTLIYAQTEPSKLRTTIELLS